jgi:uncharacterized protein YkwD
MAILRALVYGILLLMLVVPLADSQVQPPNPTTHGDCTVLSAALAIDDEEAIAWEAISSYRVEHGLAALIWSPNLIESATLHATDMATRNYFNHISLTPDNRFPGARMFACGYPTSAGWGENIAAGWNDGVRAFEGWRNSPPHNALMLTAAMQVGGIARAYNEESNWGWYWVLNLGTQVDTVMAVTPTPTPTPTPTATYTPTVMATPATTATPMLGLPTIPPRPPGRYRPTMVPIRP